MLLALMLSFITAFSQDSISVTVPYKGTIEYTGQSTFKYKPQVLHDTIPIQTQCPLVDTVAIRKGYIKDTATSVIITPTLGYDRWLYVDKTDTIYNNITSRNRLASYLKKNHFNGVLNYSTNSILASSANYANLQAYNKVLSDSGIVTRAAVLGSGNTTNFNNFYNSTPDITKKFNVINLESEWWNGATSFANWLTQMESIYTYCKSKGLESNFYEGWYLNLGTGVTDSAAAYKQMLISHQIAVHDYENNRVSYSYLAPRLIPMAKAAKARNQGKEKIKIIISAEQKQWGANNDFAGLLLMQKGFDGVEKLVIDDFNKNASQEVKDWIDITGFIWFMKRYVWQAVPYK